MKEFLWTDGNALRIVTGVVLIRFLNTGGKGRMKTTNNGSLLDFYREEGRHLDLMNAFMTRFQKENVIYVCGVVKGYIPGNKLALYHRRFRGKI